MTVVTSKSRPGSIVAEAYRLKEIDERRMKRIASMTKKPEPVAEIPAAAPKKTTKPQRAAKKGKR